MPIFAVNSEGVSFAMSFICGLSTMATLIAPPFVPDAGVPPPVDPDLLLEPPPQPVATTPMTASTAAADRSPIVPLISLSSCFVGGQRDPPTMEDLYRWFMLNVKPNPRRIAGHRMLAEWFGLCL